MATLDIRNVPSDPIDEIIFGRGQDQNSMRLVKSTRTTEFILFDLEERSGYVAISDIDNLILALQKAKELWGNK